MWDSRGQITVTGGIQGHGRTFFTSGWSAPEQGETWSVGPVSKLSFTAPPRAVPYIIGLTLRPHVIEGKLPVQRLTLLVNGEKCASFTMPRRAVRACRIPAHLIAKRTTLDIEFHLTDAARPADFAQGSDTRQLGVALINLNLYPEPYAEPPGDRPIDIDRIIQADSIPLQSLLLQFESLGQNCEFGLVQRACHAEPLGLLRFSSTPLAKLLPALDARFEGMGAPDSISVELSANGREFMINDSRFGFLYHAFVDAGAMMSEELHKREVRRVPFLVRKLIEDLDAAEKIFVFKAMGAIPEEEIYPLFLALRRYGPNCFLWVTLADATHPGGSVEQREPGFLIGYLDRFAPTEAAADFLLPQWVSICRAAYRLHLAARA